MQPVTTITGLQDTYSVVKLSAQSQVDNLQLAESFTGYVLKAAAKSVDCSDTLEYTESPCRTELGCYPDFLNLPDEFSAALSKRLADTLVFGDQFNLNRQATWGVSDSLTWAEGFLAVRTGADTLYRYAPQGVLPPLVGPSAGVPGAVPTSLPGDWDRDRSCHAPGTEPRQQGPLGFNRSPARDPRRHAHRSADPIWPKTQRLILNFSSLPRPRLQGLLAFFENHLGRGGRPARLGAAVLAGHHYDARSPRSSRTPVGGSPRASSLKGSWTRLGPCR